MKASIMTTRNEWSSAGPARCGQAHRARPAISTASTAFTWRNRPCSAPGEQYRMTDNVLSAFIAKYIASQPTPVVEFVWQGGEPRCWGSISSRESSNCRSRLPEQKTITNSLQTNGTLLKRMVPVSEEEQFHGRDQPRRPERNPRPLPPRPQGTGDLRPGNAWPQASAETQGRIQCHGLRGPGDGGKPAGSVPFLQGAGSGVHPVHSDRGAPARCAAAPGRG